MTFDSDFLAKLRKRDPSACTLFVYTFTPILEAKLRYKFRDRGTIEDLVNETFYRVLVQVDKNAIRDPSQFGSFVRGVCENVAREHIRKASSTVSWPDGFEPPDRVLPIDELLADKELKELLRMELRRLTHEEEILITEYFEEKDRSGLARDRGITVSGLNVKLHRALKHLVREFRNKKVSTESGSDRQVKERPRARHKGGGRGNRCQVTRKL
jgi:RNA polymerase sigma factor (sigma-70 family)